MTLWGVMCIKIMSEINEPLHAYMRPITCRPYAQILPHYSILIFSKTVPIILFKSSIILSKLNTSLTKINHSCSCIILRTLVWMRKS